MRYLVDHDALTRSNDPSVLLRYAQQHGSERKVRLYLCATAEKVRDYLNDPAIWGAVGVAERYADGLASQQELAAAHRAACKIADRQTGLASMDDAQISVADAAWWVAHVACPAIMDEWTATRRTVLIKPAVQCALLWEAFLPIYVNAASGVSCPFSWISSTVHALATFIYDERKFQLMPILADALQDAGCEEQVILSHCRGDGPHVRGCWVIDLILGKE